MGRLTAMSTLKVTDRGAEKHPALFVTDPLNRSPTQTSVLSITMTLSDWNEYDTNNDNKALRARMNAMILRKEILQDLIEVNQITLELSGEPYQRPVDPDFDLRRRCQDIPWLQKMIAQDQREILRLETRIQSRRPVYEPFQSGKRLFLEEDDNPQPIFLR